MNFTSLTTLAAAGFAVAFFHAALPTHWLPFVIVGHTKQWSRKKTLFIALVAGAGHVLLTSLLGLVIAWCGLQIDERLEHAFPWLAGGLLLAIGGYYTWRQFRGIGVCRHGFGGGSGSTEASCHHKEHDHHDHGSEALKTARSRDWAAISGLFVMLTLSPCEGFLPVYLSGAQFGWTGFFVLSAILALATLLGMLVFTASTLVGIERLGWRRWQRYDAGVLGALFSGLGLCMLVVGH